MKSRGTPEALKDFGSYLYILGAVKSYQADKEWSDDRKRATHLIAARYLQKARELGVPDEREGQLIYLLGQSLVYGNQAAGRNSHSAGIAQDTLRPSNSDCDVS